MPPQKPSHHRNQSTPVRQAGHAPTASSDASRASLHKSRQLTPQFSFQDTSSASSPPSATPDVFFDPKSILPASKSQKSWSTLSKASSSLSSNMRIRSQTLSFSCIDGETRNFSSHSPSAPLALPDLSAELQTAPSERHPSTSQAQDRVQFTAFGIQAYPTRATINQVCYDFTSNRRWCSYGSRCYRVHPLNRDEHIANAIHESIKISRARQGQLEQADSLTVEPLIQLSSLRLSQAADEISSSRQPRVNLPRSNIVTSTLPVGPRIEPYHLTIEDELERWGPQNDIERRNQMRRLPWAYRSESDTSSSSNNSDDGNDVWDPHTDEHDWSSSATEDEVLYGGSTPQQSHISSFSNLPRHSGVLDQNEQSVDNSRRTVRHPRPQNKLRCQRYLRNECDLGYDCSFIHDDLDYDAEVFSEVPPHPETSTSSKSSIVVKNRPRPQTKVVCREWLHGRCRLGYDCEHIHNDLTYDGDDQPAGERSSDGRLFTLFGHMKVRVGSGFHIQEFTTGFESQCVDIGNLPQDLTDDTLTMLLRHFGEIVKIHRHPQPFNPLTVRVQFLKPSAAYQTFYSLHGQTEFGRKLDLRMAVETKNGGSLIENTLVRIDWEAPHRNVYMGYPNIFVANEAVAKARQIPCDGFMAHATLHVGLPAVGQVTVKFTGVPVDITEERMEELYGPHQGMVTERPNYTDYTAEDTVKGMTNMLQRYNSRITETDFRRSPYPQGRMRVWVTCSSPSDAQAVAADLHGRKPKFTCRTRIKARHMKSIKYTLQILKYHKVATELKTLAGQVWKQGAGYRLTIIEKPLFVSLTLSGEDVQVLRRLKGDVEQTLNGQLVVEGGVVAWDDFLGRPVGILFLQELERHHPGITIERDPSRRTLRLFGAADLRAVAQEKILEKIQHMRSQKSYAIPLEGRLANSISGCDLHTLQERLGAENVTLDPWNRLLRIRGDKESFAIAQDVVALARVKQQGSSRSTVPTGHECPVCFDEPTSPIRLPCGHSWCRSCLQRYFSASIDQKIFPVVCLGNEGKCKEPVPLYITKDLMTPGELDAIVNSAFSLYVQTRPNDYHYCPTPDCSQVYPTAPEGVSIQCPSCLLRICPSCHKDSHDGLTCSENKNGEELFQSWAEEHKVKQCPGCRISIEKDEGCNHMMCTLCKTHICWVCLRTFPNGDGIYAHMGSQHGDFGLGPLN